MIVDEINKEDFEEEIDGRVLGNIPLNLYSNSIRAKINKKKEKEKEKENNPKEKNIDSDDIIFKSSKNIMTINNFF